MPYFSYLLSIQDFLVFIKEKGFIRIVDYIITITQIDIKTDFS